MKLKDLIVIKYLFFSLALWGFIFYGCTEKENDKSKTEAAGEEHSAEIVLSPEIMQEIGIEVGKPRHTVLHQNFTAQGKVVVNPDYVAHLNSLVIGRVRKIHVQIGDYVKKATRFSNWKAWKSPILLLIISAPKLIL